MEENKTKEVCQNDNYKSTPTDSATPTTGSTNYDADSTTLTAGSTNYDADSATPTADSTTLTAGSTNYDADSATPTAGSATPTADSANFQTDSTNLNLTDASRQNDTANIAKSGTNQCIESEQTTQINKQTAQINKHTAQFSQQTTQINKRTTQIYNRAAQVNANIHWDSTNNGANSAKNGVNSTNSAMDSTNTNIDSANPTVGSANPPIDALRMYAEHEKDSANTPPNAALQHMDRASISRKKQSLKIKSIATTGICTALALILSYIEFLLPPVYAPLPMIKCGLSNIALLFAVYKLSPKQSALIALLKVVLTALLFGSFVSLVYSASGAIFSLMTMELFKKKNRFSPIGVSVLGAVFHNAGQILAATVLMSTATVLSYMPLLILTGTVSGIIVGIIGGMMIKLVNPD